MYKLITLLILLFTLTSCGNSDEKKAKKYLDAAKISFIEGNYTKAKLQIDSVKICYPKAFETRREGIRLMLEVEKEEQIKGLSYLDSLEIAKTEEFEAIKKEYILEKEEKYQEIGNYITPTQRLEPNLNRTYLRFMVNELGVMTMTATYSAQAGINHHTVTVTAPDGSFAKTPMCPDTFSSTNLGRVTEKSDFKLGDDGGVIHFIVLNHDKKLKVTYSGDRDFHYYLMANDKQAAVKIEKLTQVLATLTEVKAAKEEAHLKLKFVENRMARNDSIDGNKPAKIEAQIQVESHNKVEMETTLD